MSSEITLRHLQYFVAAVEEGTMTAAGTRLGASPSAVSMGIADLESAAGEALLVRIPRKKLELTSLGDDVFADARSVVETAARIDQVFRHGNQPSGTVRLSCFAPFSPFLVPDLMRAIAAQAPGIELDISEDPVEQAFPLLLDGSIDLAVLYEDRMPEQLAFEPITKHWPYVIVSGEHRLAGAAEIDLHELVDEPFVYVKQRERSYFEQIISDLGIHPVSKQSTWNMETMRTMVGRNEAWSLMIGPRPMSSVSPEGRAIAGSRMSNRVAPGRPMVAWSTLQPLSSEARLVADLMPDVFRAGLLG